MTLRRTTSYSFAWACSSNLSSTDEHWVGKGKRELNAEDIEDEIRGLRDRAKRVVEFADKAVAHHDKVAPSELPTFGEIEEVVKHLEHLVQKYVGLFLAHDLDMGIYMQYDWAAIFRIAWIPDELAHRVPTD